MTLLGRNSSSSTIGCVLLSVVTEYVENQKDV